MNSGHFIEAGVCLALLVFLLWKEGRRSDRARLVGRIVATVLAVAALAGLILPVMYHRVWRTAGEGREGIYLTEGYEEDSVKQFLRTHPDIHAVWGEASGPDGGVWPVNRLHVFGYGLTRQEWAALCPPSLIFHPGRPIAGIVAVDWRRRLFAGERLQVQGHWQTGLGARPVKLLLMGLGAVLDSTRAGGDFLLATVPAQMGKAVYRLAAIDGADTLEQEELPVEVGYGRPLNILILAATPDFENTFLVNWLAKNGQRVAIRTMVSRDRYQSSFVNSAPRSLDKLTASLLDSCDIVIADSSALPAAGDAASSVLRRQVEEKGLGLIIKIDSGMRKKPGMHLYGLGKVVYTTLNTTYVQVMAGQSAAYAAYWSDLLRRVGREEETGEDWQWIPAEPRVREPAELLLKTGREGQPQGLIDGAQPVSVYLAQDAVLPFEWRGTYWPVEAGWQALHSLQGDTSWGYVWPGEAWKALYRERRRTETVSYLAGVGKGAKADAGDERVQSREEAIPRYWFYIVFLLSMLFLWVERKISGMNGGIMR